MKRIINTVSRRTIIASTLPALAVAQIAPTVQPAPDYLAISATQYRRNAEALAKVPVPVETEPAFHFKP